MNKPNPPNPEQREAATAEMFKHIANYGGGPAHPQQMQWGMTDGIPNVWFAVGLTKREHIAAIIAASISGSLSYDQVTAISEGVLGGKHVIQASVNLADALLERLKPNESSP